MIKCPGCGEENPPKFRLCGYCGTQLPQTAQLPVHELRKTVTILFSDLKDSTALGEQLDSEALHEVKERYFGAMAAEIKRHGGKIEKYIGDAIMAVFGLPRAHEDDALRAVRAAIGMQSVLADVNRDLQARFGISLANRTGLNTGEVVTTDDVGVNQKLVTGDAVNLAARLEQAAPKNEILIGETTYRLVRDAVEVAAVEPLTLKGKTQPVAAYKLLRADGFDGNTRRHDALFVGRENEIQGLRQALQDAIAERRPRLATILGDAGLGKTRLVKELIERSGREADNLAGRCLPYGEGITFWPLRDMVVAATGIRQDDTPEVAVQRVRERVGDDEVTERLAAAAGFSARAFPLHEIYWGARRFLQIMARERPVIALFDDIHWAEPAFLDLLENLVETMDDAPVLLLATARPELLEERADWCQRERAVRLVLQPLDDKAAAEVVTNLLGAAGLPNAMLARVVEAAEGNPLYVEQLLGMLIDNGIVRREGEGWICVQPDAALAVPPTINALLEARLDRLGRSERATAEPAAVMGLEFRGDAVSALAPEAVRPEIDRQLNALTRKQFIRPTGSTSQVAVFRFHHHLVRETVYNGLLKRNRANLHIAFVKWADQINADNDRAQEYEAILGYHLEQAYKYLGELGPLSETDAAIGRDGAQRLASAGRRAFGKGDMLAAVNLLRRAVALLQADEPARGGLQVELGEVLIEVGRFADARAVLSEAEEAGTGRGDELLQASAHLLRLRIGMFSADEVDSGERTLQAALEAIPLFDRHDHALGLARAWRLVALVHGIAARYGESTAAMTKSIEYARRIGDERLLARNGLGLASSTLLGPTKVIDAIVLSEQAIGGGLADRQAESKILCMLAQLYAMNGEFTKARHSYRHAREMLRELGQGLIRAGTAIDVLVVELLAGDRLALAEAEVRSDLDFLKEAGETYRCSTVAALLSRTLRELGRDDEALALSVEAEQLSASDDVDSQALWRSVRAPLLARAGQFDGARALSLRAVELLEGSDSPQLQADTRYERAITLATIGDDARSLMQEAIATYLAKGDTVSAARGERWLHQ